MTIEPQTPQRLEKQAAALVRVDDEEDEDAEGPASVDPAEPAVPPDSNEKAMDDQDAAEKPTAQIVPCETYEITPAAFSGHGSSVNGIAATHNMAWVLSGTEDGWLRVWDTAATFRGDKLAPTHDRGQHPDGATRVGVLLNAFAMHAHVRSPTGQWVVAQSGPLKGGSATGGVDGAPLVPVTALAMHGEGLWALAGLGSGDVQLHTLRHDEGRCHAVFQRHSARVLALALTPSEHAFASGGFDRTVRLWDLDTGEMTAELAGHAFHVVSLAWEPQAAAPALLSTSFDGAALLWDVRRPGGPSQRLVPSRTAAKPWSKSSTWSCDARYVHIGRKTAAVDEYDVRMGAHVRTIQLPVRTGPINATVAMPNNKHLVCASSDSLRLYNLRQENETGTTIGLSDADAESPAGVPYVVVPGRSRSMISQMLVDPQGRYLVTASGTRGLEERVSFASFGAAAALSTNEVLFYSVKPIGV